MREAHHLLLALPFSQEVGAEFWKSSLGHVTKGTQVFILLSSLEGPTKHQLWKEAENEFFFLFQEAANTRLKSVSFEGSCSFGVQD